MGSGVSSFFNRAKTPKEEEKPYYVRISLSKAVPAAVLIQTRMRMILARRKLVELFEEKQHQEMAAAQYLNALVNNDPHSVHYAGSLVELSASGTYSGSQKQTNTHHLAASRSRKHSFSNSFHISDSPLTRLLAGEHTLRSVTSLNEDHEFLFDEFNAPALQQVPPVVILPLVGFVIKTKFKSINKKVFINVCHSEHIDKLLCTSMKEWMDTSHHDEDGYIKFTPVVIIDVVYPTAYFMQFFQEKATTFSYIPKVENNRSVIAEEVIGLINLYLTETLKGEKDELVSAELEKEDFETTTGEKWLLDTTEVTFPKMKRNYTGNFTKLIYTKNQYWTTMTNPRYFGTIDTVVPFILQKKKPSLSNAAIMVHILNGGSSLSLMSGLNNSLMMTPFNAHTDRGNVVGGNGSVLGSGMSGKDTGTTTTNNTMSNVSNRTTAASRNYMKSTSSTPSKTTPNKGNTKETVSLTTNTTPSLAMKGKPGSHTPLQGGGKMGGPQVGSGNSPAASQPFIKEVLVPPELQSSMVLSYVSVKNSIIHTASAMDGGILSIIPAPPNIPPPTNGVTTSNNNTNTNTNYMLSQSNSRRTMNSLVSAGMRPESPTPTYNPRSSGGDLSSIVSNRLSLDAMDELESHQITYAQNLLTMKEGFPVYIDLHLGMLYIYEKSFNGISATTTTTTTDTQDKQYKQDKHETETHPEDDKHLHQHHHHPPRGGNGGASSSSVSSSITKGGRTFRSIGGGGATVHKSPPRPPPGRPPLIIPSNNVTTTLYPHSTHSIGEHTIENIPLPIGVGELYRVNMYNMEVAISYDEVYKHYLLTLEIIWLEDMCSMIAFTGSAALGMNGSTTTSSTSNTNAALTTTGMMNMTTAATTSTLSSPGTITSTTTSTAAQSVIDTVSASSTPNTTSTTGTTSTTSSLSTATSTTATTATAATAAASASNNPIANVSLNNHELYIENLLYAKYFHQYFQQSPTSTSTNTRAMRSSIRHNPIYSLATHPPERLIFQFNNLSEAMTWKLVFETHIAYAKEAMKYLVSKPIESYSIGGTTNTSNTTLPVGGTGRGDGGGMVLPSIATNLNSNLTSTGTTRSTIFLPGGGGNGIGNGIGGGGGITTNSLSSAASTVSLSNASMTSGGSSILSHGTQNLLHPATTATPFTPFTSTSTATNVTNKLEIRYNNFSICMTPHTIYHTEMHAPLAHTGWVITNTKQQLANSQKNSLSNRIHTYVPGGRIVLPMKPSSVKSKSSNRITSGRYRTNNNNSNNSNVSSPRMHSQQPHNQHPNQSNGQRKRCFVKIIKGFLILSPVEIKSSYQMETLINRFNMSVGNSGGNGNGGNGDLFAGEDGEDDWERDVEIINLVNKKLAVKHKRIIRLRKYMTRLIVTDYYKGRFHKCFFLRGDGDHDPEISNLIHSLQQNIDYASTQLFRYHLLWLKECTNLLNPHNIIQENSFFSSIAAAVTNFHRAGSSLATTPALLGGAVAASSVVLNVIGIQVDIAITKLDPATSDDDSDLDEKDFEEFIHTCLYRVLKPKNLRKTTGKEAAGAAATAADGNALNEEDGDDEDAQSTTNANGNAANAAPAYDHEILAEKYGFPSIHPTTGLANPIASSNSESAGKQPYLPCSMYYLQELSLLLLFYSTRLIGVLSIEKCLEQSYKIPLAAQKKYQRAKIKTKLQRMQERVLRSNNNSSHMNKAGSVTATAVLDAKVYTLDSSDEENDSGSDRDYQMDDDPVLKGFVEGAGAGGGMLEDEDEDDGGKYPWIIQLLAYDGRHYRIKFAQKADYSKWQVLFSTNSMLPFCQKPSSADGGGRGGTSSTTNGGGPMATGNMMMNPNTLNGLLLGMNNNNINNNNTVNSSTKVDELSNPEHTLTAFAADISYDHEAAKKYARLLRSGEKVLAAGTIFKFEKTMSYSSTSNAPKQRRILLVTDLPRMIFIDTIGSIVRGNLELSSETKVDVRSLDSTDFEVNVGGNVSRFSSVELPDKDSKYWCAKIRLAITLKNL